MSSPKLSLNSDFRVYLFHVCSGCGFPVVSTATIKVFAQKDITFNTPEGARQILKETTATAVQSAIDMINRCRKKKVALDPGVFGMHSMGLAHYYDSKFFGYETPCPYCMNIEPWQNVNADKQHLSDLEEINYPYVTKHLDKAEKWACDYVDSLIEEIDEQRTELDSEDICKAETEVAATNSNIADLIQRYSTLPERIQAKTLKVQINELAKEKKLLGALDLAKKAELSLSIKSIQRNLRVVEENLTESERPIKAQLRYEREKLLKAQAIAYGCTGQIETITARNNICYLYTPNKTVTGNIEVTEYDSEFNLEDEPEFVYEDETETEVFTEEPEIVEPTPSFCKKCGNKLPADSVYCPYCGSKI